MSSVSRLRAASSLRAVQPVAELAHPFVRGVDGRSRSFEEVVDDVAVVATKRLGDLDVTQFSRGDLHGDECTPELRARRAYVAAKVLVSRGSAG